jgi:phage N-6-adenine-methyltransferase
MKFRPETAAEFGRRGGRAVTRAKARAARRNGRQRKRLRGSLAVMTASRSVEWYTPPALFADLAAEFGGFGLDPCCTPESALCPTYYTREDDGLTNPWFGHVFMNPPYGKAIAGWMRKAWEEPQRGALVVCLVPARVDTAWWHEYAMRGEVRTLRGRLTFANARNPAPFPSAVVVFRPPVAPCPVPLSPGYPEAAGLPGRGSDGVGFCLDMRLTES